MKCFSDQQIAVKEGFSQGCSMSSCHNQLLFFCPRDKISLAHAINNDTTFLFQRILQNLLRNVAK